MKLSQRLQTIFDMVPYAVTADIGADHGKLIMSLFMNGKIPSGYAVENKKGPYDRLVKNLHDNGLNNDIIPLFSSGIKDLPPSVSTIIIAGMGGNTIVEIIKSGASKLKNIQTIIVDAHSLIPEVRKCICSFGYIISDEKIIKESDIYYEIIKFIKSDIAALSDDELDFGPILINEKCRCFKEKYMSRIEEIMYLLNHHDLPKEKINSLNDEIERIKRIL